MSLPFLFFAILLSSLGLLLFYSLCSHIFKAERKKQSAAPFYKPEMLRAFWQSCRHELSHLRLKPFFKLSFLYLAFYLCLHLLFPFWGFALFLHSDGNFLVIVGSVFISLQLHHRLFFQAKK